MFSSVRRLALLAIVAATLTACTGVRVADPDPRPTPTPDQPYGPYPTLPVTGGEPPTGNTGQEYPALSVARDGGGYVVDLVDPDARAWWIVVSGTGSRSGDRLEIVAEAGDVWPGAIVRQFVDGTLVDTTDLNGFVGTPTAAVGGCHPGLEVCYSSGQIAIDAREGRLSVVLEAEDGTALLIRGATAGWDGEPFVLGPWRGTEAVRTA